MAPLIPNAMRSRKLSGLRTLSSVRSLGGVK
jgi:hypothetical protein